MVDFKPGPGIRFNANRKFDMQLSEAIINERGLGAIFTDGVIQKIELKSETHQWEQTGNIAIEYRCDGKPSGISTTEATCWVHELKRNGKTLVYLMFPVARLRQLCKAAHRAGHYRLNGGDGHRFDVILLPLSEILK